MADAAWLPPEEFDEYRILRPLGRGAMGAVFLAHDTLLDRVVAIKFIAGLAPDRAARERFLVEARAAARLSHPNVAQVHRVGLLAGQPYLVSEFIRGQGLDQLDKPVPGPQLLGLALGLARGLAAAHERGVLHRDLKPANAVLADDGEVKLLDFGIAKLLDPLPPAHEATATSARGGAAGAGATAEAAGLVRATAEAAGAAHATAEAAGPAPTAAANLEATLPRGVRPLVANEAETLAPAAPPSLTETGTLLGTPLYMAPEIWRGEAATRRSDVYGLGALLYHLATGLPPRPGRTVAEIRRAVLAGDPPPVATRAKGVDPRLAAVIDRSLRADPALRPSSGAELRDALEEVGRGARRLATPSGNPYRGLERFEAEHRGLFFGRDRDAAALVERLRASPFVLVTGDSGVGKSSLCRAGVLPAVLEGALAAERTWQVATLCPGRHPAAALRSALEGFASGAGREGGAGPAGDDLRELVAALGRQLGKTRGLVVFVDQLEELVTLAAPAEARTAAEALAELVVGAPGLRLLATARSDFLSQLAALDRLGDEVPSAVHVLRPLGRDAIRDAVVRPALAVGVRFESDALVESIVGAAESLPLLQFALAELWEARDPARAEISAQALEAIGGVAGALARHADGVLAALRPPERAAARRILTSLVSARGTRAPRAETELARGGENAARALEALARGRLLVAREAEDGATAFELSHEALLAGWTTLRAWLDESAERRAARERLEAAVVEWERLAKSGDALWSARQLEDAKLVPAAELDARARAFLDASERALRQRWRRRVALAVGLPLFGALLYAGMYLQGRRELAGRVDAELAEATAAETRARAHAEGAERLRVEALALFEQGETELAERAWSRVLAGQVEAERGYADAGRAFEVALQLAPARRDVCRRFARFLGAWIDAAGRDGRRNERLDLLARLALYDDDGEERRRLLSPARLRVATFPPGADVVVERYELAEGGRREPTPQGAFAATPTEAELAPGSYRLRLRAPGRVEVLYPLLLAAGERLALEVPLPAPGEVPAGFVFVPAGRFLFGSNEEGIRKAFLNTVPQHERTTGAFFIARHEVTFGDWIDYLNALPEAEQRRRVPRPGDVAYRGSVGLAKRGGRWALIIQPGERVYEALEGERIVFPARARRRDQDWRRFPVALVSADDADAYARWLAATGRVPRARLCIETEWERAARGADDRVYPHGDYLAPDDANYDETYAREPLGIGYDEVGSHPASSSPFGVDDLTGNVMEWTRPSFGGSFATSGVAATSGRQMVLRAGAWLADAKTALVTNRALADAGFRDMMFGVRLCADYTPAPP